MRGPTPASARRGNMLEFQRGRDRLSTLWTGVTHSSARGRVFVIPHTLNAQPSRPHPAIIVASSPSSPLSHFGQLAQAVAETLATRRDPRQLHPLMTRTAFESLQDNIGVYGLRQTPRLRRLRSLSPRPGALEVCAVVQCDRRARALALRFEGVGRYWLCSYLRTA